uniref:Uncharacterized protein n=1 Tax=Anguilla anguilla TaxID=7936 RepID=A0A0E9UYU5_ANGAN
MSWIELYGPGLCVCRENGRGTGRSGLLQLCTEFRTQLSEEHLQEDLKLSRDRMMCFLYGS